MACVKELPLRECCSNPRQKRERVRERHGATGLLSLLAQPQTCMQVSLQVLEFVTGEGDVVDGLELCAADMKKGEKAACSNREDAYCFILWLHKVQDAAV